MTNTSNPKCKMYICMINLSIKNIMKFVFKELKLTSIVLLTILLSDKILEMVKESPRDTPSRVDFIEKALR